MINDRLKRYVYYGIPPTTDKTYFYEIPPVTDKARFYINKNREIEDEIIKQIVYRILTRIELYKPESEIEINPITKIKLNL
jgi:hypothetical protein